MTTTDRLQRGQPFGLGRLLLTAAVVAALLVGATRAMADSEGYAVSGFKHLEFGGTGSMRVVQDGTEGLSVEGDADAIEQVQVKVRGSTLVVKVEGDHGWMNWFSSSPDVSDLQFTLHVKELERIHLSGAVELRAERVESAGEVEIDLSGATDLRVEQVLAGAVRLDGSGATSVHLAGSARQLRLRLSGAGDVDAGDLVVEQADVGISGAADASVHATETLDVRVSGAGDVRYRGAPTVSQRVSGAGSVSRLGS